MKRWFCFAACQQIVRQILPLKTDLDEQRQMNKIMPFGFYSF
jgi:hypothetical protein